MAEIDAAIFIDSNQYLDLYRVTTGKKLLEPLKEQKDYIFVTSQIVDEVQRNKLYVAADFLTKQFEELKVRGFDVPDHLFDTDSDTASRLRERLSNLGSKIKELNNDLRNAAIETLQRISRSEDEVSKALEIIFSKATTHTPAEMDRARDRKERGNPPGKKGDPLGDQLSWEQLLSHYKRKPHLWIIARDSDYSIKHGGERLLNSFLYQDLVRTVSASVDVHCFGSIDDGIRDFVQSTGVKAEKLPSPEESKEIKEEFDSLPPVDWVTSSMGITSYTPQRSWSPQYNISPYYTNVSNPDWLFLRIIPEAKKSQE